MISREMSERSKMWKGMIDRQVKSHVGYVRKQQHGRDIFQTLESGHMSLLQDTKFFCLQFNVTISDDKNNCM